MKLSLNSVHPSVFKVSAAETADNTNARATIVGTGRMLAYEYARKGAIALRAARGRKDNEIASVMSPEQYKEANIKFQQSSLLYAARQADAVLGKKGPENFEEFKKNGQNYIRNELFLKVLMGRKC